MKLPATTPKWAAKVWCEGDSIYADLDKHTLRFDNDSVGLSKLLSMVRSRTAKTKIATRGEPLQSQLDQSLAEFKGRIKHVGKRKVVTQYGDEATAVLKRMGMI